MLPKLVQSYLQLEKALVEENSETDTIVNEAIRHSMYILRTQCMSSHELSFIDNRSLIQAENNKINIEIVEYIHRMLVLAVKSHHQAENGRLINISPQTLETKAKEICRVVKKKLNN